MVTIGEVARRLNITADAVRYYERAGLLAPASRTAAGYRLYEEDAVRRLHFIKQAQQCGFSLSEIRALLDIKARDTSCCDDVRHLAITKKLQLEHNIRVLKAMSGALSELIEICTEKDKPLDACPIVAALEKRIAMPRPSGEAR